MSFIEDFIENDPSLYEDYDSEVANVPIPEHHVGCSYIRYISGVESRCIVAGHYGRVCTNPNWNRCDLNKKGDIKMTEKRCITNMDGRLLLTVGRLYEVLDGRISGMVITRNDNGEVMGYPDQYFVGSTRKIKGITERIIPDSVYDKGDVLDIRYINDGLPNRVLVLDKRFDDTNGSGDWLYDVLLESNGETVKMYEKWLIPRVKAKKADVYKLPAVANRYACGLRWMGNYHHDTANKKREEINRSGVAQAFIREAYDGYGNIIDKSSIWIKYADINIIGDGGYVGQKSVKMCTRDREECDLCIYGKNGNKVVDRCVK